MTKNKMLLAGSVLLLTLIASCATVPMASLDDDQAAKQFSPKSGMANIYVARSSAVGQAILFSIALDGKLEGQLANKTFYFFEVGAGEHEVNALSPEDAETLTLNTEPGKNYFIKVSPQMGMMAARVKIEEVGELEGIKLVSKCSLAERGALKSR